MSQFPPGYHPHQQQPPQLPHSQQLDAIHTKLDELAVDVAGLKSRPPLVDVRPPWVVNAAAWVIVVLFTGWLTISTLRAIIEILREEPWKSETQKRTEQAERERRIKEIISEFKTTAPPR